MSIHHHEDCDVHQATLASEGPYGDPTVNPDHYQCLPDCEESVTVADIEGVLTLSNGERVRFRLTPEHALRWGNISEHLGHTVDPTEAMWDALNEGGHFENEED